MVTSATLPPKTKPGSREKVLVAATELFCERGFSQASIEEILKLAHVTKSNFYYHFSSKEALGMEVLIRLQKEMKTEVWPRTLCDLSKSPLDRIESFVECIVDNLNQTDCRSGCPFANLAVELSDGWPKFRQALAAFFAETVTEIGKCVRDGQRVGEIPAELNPDKTAQLFFAQLEGAVILAKTYKNTAPILESFEAMKKLIQR